MGKIPQGYFETCYIKDVSEDECVLAGVIRSYDGKVKEYRHYQNTFWVVDDEAPQRLIQNASCRSVGTTRNEQEYNEGMASTSICIDRDEKQERIDDIQKEADDYICCDGHCWRKRANLYLSYFNGVIKYHMARRHPPLQAGVIH